MSAPQPQGRGQQCPTMPVGGEQSWPPKYPALAQGCFQTATWRQRAEGEAGYIWLQSPDNQGEKTNKTKKNSRLVLLITSSQTESVQPNGHLHEGLSVFLGNQRLSDLSGKLKKRMLRQWLVLGFCSRHLTKKVCWILPTSRSLLELQGHLWPSQGKQNFAALIAGFSTSDHLSA